MAAAPGDPVVSSIPEWNALIRSAGAGAAVTLVGELVDEPQKGHRAEVLVAMDAGGQAGFAPIGVMVDSFHRLEPQPRRRSTGLPERQTPATTSGGHRVTVRGRIDVDRRGGIVVKGGALKIDTTTRGPYSAWRAAQASEVGGGPVGGVARANVRDIVGYLRGQPASKQILWLGRDSTQAYRDVHRNNRELIAAMEVAGAAMSGPRAVEEMCTALAAVDADRTSLVVVARGGGDRGDLAVFDDARLLRAVQECPIPSVCAVGHYRDQPLIEGVCDWALAVPSDVRKALYPAVTGAPTAEEERAHQERQVSELERARAAIVHLERERDSSRCEVDALRRGWLVTVRAENARRIRQGHQILAWSMVLSSPVMAWLWALAAPPTWRTSWYQPLAVLAAVWVVAAVVGRAPRRLDRRPWLRRARAFDLATAYRTAKGVGAFNRVAAAHDGVTPRLRRGAR